eukprot:403349694
MKLDLSKDKIFGLVLNQPHDILYVTGAALDGYNDYASIVGIDIKNSSGNVTLFHMNNKVPTRSKDYYGTYVDVIQDNDKNDVIYNVITDRNTIGAGLFVTTYVQRVQVQEKYSVSSHQLILLPKKYNIVKLKAKSSNIAYIMGDDQSSRRMSLFELNFTFSATRVSFKQINYQGYNSKTLIYSARFKDAQTPTISQVDMTNIAIGNLKLQYNNNWSGFCYDSRVGQILSSDDDQTKEFKLEATSGNRKFKSQPFNIAFKQYQSAYDSTINQPLSPNILQTMSSNSVQFQVIATDLAGNERICLETSTVIFNDDNCTYPGISITPQPFIEDDISYTIGDLELIFTFDDWIYTPSTNNCGTFTYSLIAPTDMIQQNIISMPPAKNEVHIFSDDIKISGQNFTISVKGQLSNGFSSFQNYSFSIINPCDELDLDDMDDVYETYYVRSNQTTINIPFNAFNQSEPNPLCQQLVSSQTIEAPTNLPLGIVIGPNKTQNGYEIKVCVSVISSPIEDIYYNMSSKLATFDIIEWEVNPDVFPAVCETIEYTPFYNDKFQMPSFISFDQGLMQFSIQSLEPKDEGTYSIKFQGASAGVSKNITFNVFINNPCKNAQIIKSTISDQTYRIGKESVIKFPKWKSSISGCEDFEYSAIFSGIDSIDSVITFKNDDRSITIKTTDPQYKDKKIKVQIYGKAYYGQDFMEFNIEIQENTQKTDVKETQNEIIVEGVKIDKEKLTKKLTASISDVSQYGIKQDVLQVQFTEPRYFISKSLDAILEGGYSLQLFCLQSLPKQQLFASQDLLVLIWYSLYSQGLVQKIYGCQ